MATTPLSFIATGFVIENKGSFDMIKQNEYLAQRWWEYEFLEYKEDIEICIISVEDAMNLAKNRIYIDIRDFESYHSIHLKSSYHMDTQIK